MLLWTIGFPEPKAFPDRVTCGRIKMQVLRPTRPKSISEIDPFQCLAVRRRC